MWYHGADVCSSMRIVPSVAGHDSSCELAPVVVAPPAEPVAAVALAPPDCGVVAQPAKRAEVSETISIVRPDDGLRARLEAGMMGTRFRMRALLESWFWW